MQGRVRQPQGCVPTLLAERPARAQQRGPIEDIAQPHAPALTVAQRRRHLLAQVPHAEGMIWLNP